MFGKKTVNSVISKLSEDKLYEIAVEEIENQDYVKGLWGRALAQSNGDKVKAESIYITLRVERLKDEFFVASEFASKESERQNHEEAVRKEAKRREEEAFNSVNHTYSEYEEFGFKNEPGIKYPGDDYMPLKAFAEKNGLGRLEVCRMVKNNELVGRFFSREPYIKL